MGKRKIRTDSTAAERYDRWEEKARHAGKRRLSVWLPAEAFDRLRALAQTHGLALAQTVAKVVLEHMQELRAQPTATKARRVGTNAGKSVSADGAALSPEVRELVLGWRQEGEFWAECARRLDERGIPTPKGGPWHLGDSRTNLSRLFQS